MEKEEDGDNDQVVRRWEIVVVDERGTRKGGGSWRTGTRREDSGIYLNKTREWDEIPPNHVHSYVF